MRQRVVGFLGDSFTNGQHWSSPKCYRELVAEELARTRPEVVVVPGIAWHTKNGVSVLERDILPRKPELVFVFLGANDCAHRRKFDDEQLTPPMEYDNNMRAVLATIGSAGARGALITVAPVNERVTLADPEAFRTSADVEAYNRVLHRLAAERRVRLVDIFSPMAAADIDKVLCSDGLHATLAGHRIIATEVLRAIESELSKAATGGRD